MKQLFGIVAELGTGRQHLGKNKNRNSKISLVCGWTTLYIPNRQRQSNTVTGLKDISFLVMKENERHCMNK